MLAISSTSKCLVQVSFQSSEAIAKLEKRNMFAEVDREGDQGTRLYIYLSVYRDIFISFEGSRR